MPVNAAFYSDALCTGRRYGLGRYAWELFGQLNRLPNLVRARPVSAHHEFSPADLQSFQRDHGYQPLPWGRKITAGCWSATRLPKLERWAPWADVVHCVELDYCVPTRKPLVVTIHDIGPLTHPEYFGNSHPWLLKRALRHAARRADRIICVSQATADAVQGYLRANLGDRLTVIPEGVSPEFFEPVAEEALTKTASVVRSKTPFFLWAGSLNPRKNLVNVVRAFELVADTLPHDLVLTGGIGWDAAPILAKVRQSPLKDRIHLPGRVSDEELRGLYQRATAFLYPSLLEGFGLPILEAMAAECPVITSNLSSMPEVSGDCAFLVDPAAVEDLASAMTCVATDETFATLLRRKGRARVEDFRWDACADAVVKIYEQISGASRPLSPVAPATARDWAAPQPAV